MLIIMMLGLCPATYLDAEDDWLTWNHARRCREAPCTMPKETSSGASTQAPKTRAVSAGLMRVEERFTTAGRQTSNVYHLHLGRGEGDSPSPRGGE